MNELLGFQRSDGSVGIRNNVFVVSVVVCANQVVISSSSENPSVKFVEHPHGCAQIGSDLISTRRALGRIAHHPNVLSAMYVSLGCEAVVASEVRDIAVQDNPRTVEFISIQEAGGTLNTVNKVNEWISEHFASSRAEMRVKVDWTSISIGIIIDELEDPSALPLIKAFISEVYEQGSTLIMEQDEADEMDFAKGHETQLPFGQSHTGSFRSIESGANALETMTAMALAGTHLVIHFCNKAHAFGSPLVPVFRCAVGEQNSQRTVDDFDFVLSSKAMISSGIEQLISTINGNETLAEMLELDDFSLQRIGPSV